MKNKLLLLAATALTASACTNPTVDPSSTFTVEGTATARDGSPLANADVRVIKYYDDLNLGLQPSAERLFAPTIRSNEAIGLGVELVTEGKTDADGNFSFDLLGQDFEKPNGFVDATGKVEVAETVIVVKDPDDTSGRSGVYTYSILVQQAVKRYDTGLLPLWDSVAEADVSQALTLGTVQFRWDKLERSSTTMVRNAYRMTIQAPDFSGPRLIIYCNQGDQVEGGCAQDLDDANKLTRFVSAYSIYRYYSNAGDFAAFIQGNSPDYRFVSRFTVIAPIPDFTSERDQLDVKAWALNSTSFPSSGEAQELTGTAAMDGDPMTRESITISGADAIYVSLTDGTAAPLITDAGILNSLIRNIADGCVVLEFNVNAPTDLAAATELTGWQQKGKFCGENGARDEISALANFVTTGNENGVAAGWLRLTVDTGTLSYDEVGEVAVFVKAN